MAKYRQVHTTFWDDAFVLDLTPEEKYFYLYLMTNSKTTQCGIYELPKRVIEMHSGYNRETVEKLLQRFVDYEKIEYNDKTKEIMMNNWAKYNFINSPKVKSCIVKELESVKHKPFVANYLDELERLGYRIDTVSIDYGEEQEKEKEKEEKEEKEEEKEIPCREIISYLNVKTSSNYKPSTKKTKDLIRARWNEGFTLDDFKHVIDVKVQEWLNNREMSKYLRPETLFGTKFESYLNQKGGKPGGKDPNAKGPDLPF